MMVDENEVERIAGVVRSVVDSEVRPLAERIAEIREWAAAGMEILEHNDRVTAEALLQLQHRKASERVEQGEEAYRRFIAAEAERLGIRALPSDPPDTR